MAGSLPQLDGRSCAGANTHLDVRLPSVSTSCWESIDGLPEVYELLTAEPFRHAIDHSKDREPHLFTNGLGCGYVKEGMPRDARRCFDRISETCPLSALARRNTLATELLAFSNVWQEAAKLGILADTAFPVSTGDEAAVSGTDGMPKRPIRDRVLLPTLPATTLPPVPAGEIPGLLDTIESRRHEIERSLAAVHSSSTMVGGVMTDAPRQPRFADRGVSNVYGLLYEMPGTTREPDSTKFAYDEAGRLGSVQPDARGASELGPILVSADDFDQLAHVVRTETGTMIVGGSSSGPYSGGGFASCRVALPADASGIKLRMSICHGLESELGKGVHSRHKGGEVSVYINDVLIHTIVCEHRGMHGDFWPEQRPELGRRLPEVDLRAKGINGRSVTIKFAVSPGTCMDIRSVTVEPRRR